MVLIIMTIIIKICNHNNKEMRSQLSYKDDRAPNLEKSFPKLILLTFTVFF